MWNPQQIVGSLIPPQAAGQTQLPLPEALELARNALLAGDFTQAEGLYRQVLQEAPDNFEAAHNLSVALLEQGRNEEALAAATRAGQIRPDDFKASHVRGCLLSALGRYDEAVAAFDDALAKRPDFFGCWRDLGNAHIGHGRLELAAGAMDRAMELRPDDAGPLLDLGHAYIRNRMFDHALFVLHRALEAAPRSVVALSSMGDTLLEQARMEEAISYCDQALAIKPDHPDAHFIRGLALLRLGRLGEGWLEYRWRYRLGDFCSPGVRAIFEQKQWNGQDLGGSRILLHGEQGVGDVIQCARYLPMVVARGGRIVMQVPQPLERLLGRMDGIDQFVPADTHPGQVDAYCGMMDLPSVLGITLENIPADVPYIDPYPDDVAVWRQRLGGENRLKVGLAWAGSPTNAMDTRRSIDVRLLAPLLKVEGAAFYSLQVGRDGDLARLGDDADKVADLSPHLKDFADTAAAISQLDLVISVDTAVVHLAGAMAKPVWALLCHRADWRWMEDRDDSPWYPTLRLFRQAEKDNWTPVIERVAEALCGEAGTRISRIQ